MSDVWKDALPSGISRNRAERRSPPEARQPDLWRFLTLADRALISELAIRLTHGVPPGGLGGRLLAELRRLADSAPDVADRHRYFALDVLISQQLDEMPDLERKARWWLQQPCPAPVEATEAMPA